MTSDGSILVTGAAGFLGSHLCDRLIAEGHRVHGIDDLSTGSTRHLAHLRGHPAFSFTVHDIARPLPPGLDDVTRIFSLACPASPAYYQQHPVQTLLASTHGVWQLLEFARERGATLLQTSTSEVYGDPQVHPQHEGYWGHVNPIGLRSCYDEGKRCAESLCFACERQYGTRIRVARLFNSYGPRLRPDDGRVVSNFVTQALAGVPLTIYGNGLQTRSFCYVEDTIDGLIALMVSSVQGPVNIGNPTEHTILEVADQVLRLTGSRSRIDFHPAPPDDPVRRRPDITRAKHELHWQPRIALDEGLRRTAAWFAHPMPVAAPKAA